MQQVASFPADLSNWVPSSAEQPFYLEIYGETRPIIVKENEKVSSAEDDNSTQSNVSTPIYEYSWTLGHSEVPELNSIWKGLQEEAAKVFLYFPISRGWRVRELVATVKYLTPVPQQEQWLEKISQISKDVSPFISDVSSIVRLVPGTPFPEIATVLSTIAKLQINNVPRVEGFEWSVKKVTHKSQYGVMQGIEWRIPKQLFALLGTRLTGSVAVTFIPSVDQRDYNIFDDKKKDPFQPGTLLARAEVHGPDKNQPFYIPPDQENSKKDFLEFQIAPVHL